jgi:hypothetical protein
MNDSIDTGLIVAALRQQGHTVGNVISVPSNAGEYEFEVDGEVLSLQQTRDLLEDEAARPA